MTDAWILTPFGPQEVHLHSDGMRWVDASGDTVPVGTPVFPTPHDALRRTSGRVIGAARYRAAVETKRRARYRKNGTTHAERTHEDND